MNLKTQFCKRFLLKKEVLAACLVLITLPDALASKWNKKRLERL